MLIPDAKGWKRATTKQEQQEAGAKLRTLISEAMLTRAEAADLIGVDHRTMRRYVLGQTRYPYSVWFAMQVLKEQSDAGKFKPGILCTFKRSDLDCEPEAPREELPQ